MRKFLATCAGVLALVGAIRLGEVVEIGSDRPHATDGPYDATRIDYREDEGGGRIVAEVAVELRGVGDGAQLTIVPSARGPLVDAIPGLRGVRGANLHTARELARLFAAERIDVVTQRADGKREVHGTVRVSATGRVPERRRLADGRIDYLAESREELPLALSLVTGVLGRGEWRTEVHVDGVPRLAVDLVVRDGGGEILSVRAISAHEQAEVNP